jgi:hypothetical protein
MRAGSRLYSMCMRQFVSFTAAKPNFCPGDRLLSTGTAPVQVWQLALLTAVRDLLSCCNHGSYVVCRL